MKLLLIAIGLIGVLVVSEAAPRWDYIPDENEQADELFKRTRGGDRAICFQWGWNLKGNDLTPVKERKVDSPAACQKLCLDTEGCKFWTMNSVKSCWLKTSDAGREQMEIPGVISGSKNSHMCLDYKKDYRFGPGDKDYSWLGMGDCIVASITGGKKATLFEVNDEGGNKCFEKCDATTKCSAVKVERGGLCKGYENKSGWRWFFVSEGAKSQKRCYAKVRNCDDCYNFPK